MPRIPTLTPQDETLAMAELRKKFPNVSDDTLRGFLQGETPPKATGTESAPTDPQALQHCLDLVNKTYDDAVKAAESATPAWFKACLMAAALAAAFFGRLQCYDENG